MVVHTMYRIAGNIGENFFGTFAQNEANLLLTGFCLAVIESMGSSLLGFVVIMLSTMFVRAKGPFFQYTFLFLVHM